MADKRISQLIERTDIANNDVLPIVASGATTTNKVTISTIQDWMQDNLDVGVTSVGITFGTSGTDINASGSPVTSSGNITINLPTASATNRGALSSADWITFNAKQPAGNYVTLDTAQTITAQKTFTTSGSSDTMIISHGSGSGFALDVIKAGNNEAIRVTKTSGSGNAMSITGGNFSAEAATFSGVVTTTPDAVINGVNVGKGGGNLSSNTRVGTNSLYLNTTGSGNTGIGFASLSNNTTGSGNAALGLGSMQLNTTGGSNTAIGYVTLQNNTTGNANTATGAYALENNTTGSNNTAVGQEALENNIVGAFNTAIGFQALQDNTNSSNTAIGYLASSQNSSGSANFSGGARALENNTTGSVNTSIGFASLQTNTTGGGNVAIGEDAGRYISTETGNTNGSDSVFIGRQTKPLADSQTNQIVIGYQAIGNGSNTVTIGNSSITDNYFTGNIRGGAFIKSSGTSSQFLKADGSVDSSTYLTTGSASSTYVTLDTTQTISGAKTFTSILTIGTSGNSVIYEESGSLILQTGASADLIIPSSGASTFNFGLNVMGALGVTGALNGTSASFTGAVTSLGFRSNSLDGFILRNDANSVNLGGLTRRSYWAGGTALDTQIFAETGYSIFLNPGGSSSIGLTLASTGAATFSSSVNIGASATTGKQLIVNQTGASGYFLSGEASGTEIGYWYYDASSIQFSSKSATRALTFLTSDTERMRITSGGNVGIGTPSPDDKLHIISTVAAATNNYALRLQNTTTASDSRVGIAFLNNANTGASGSGATIQTSNNGVDGAGNLLFGTLLNGTNTERMRITAEGFLKASNDGTYFGSTSPYHEIRQTTFDTNIAILTHTSTSSPYGPEIKFTGAAVNNTTNYFLICSDTSASRFVIYSNGNVQNTNNSYGSLSDIKLKENITDASPKLNDLLKVKIRNYNLIGEETKQIGVIAQELEEVFPAMVDESEDFEEVEVSQLDEEGNEVLNEEGEVVTTTQRVSKGTTTKSVKYSVFVPMLIKAIQELKIEIDSLKNQMQ
jgi:hypothetical protein